MSQTAYLPRRAYRDPDDRILGGVAAGLAAHFGARAQTVRMVFLLLVLLSGLGLLVYVALWALLPVGRPVDESAPVGVEAATRRGFRSAGAPRTRRDIGAAVSFVILALGVVVLAQNAGFGINPQVFWPLLVAGAGLCLLWWHSGRGNAHPEWLSAASGWRFWLRVVVGIGLLVAAASLALFQAGVTGALGAALGALGLGVLGVGLVVGPWLFRVNRELQAERAERARTQERADMAAHLHDSVLQTLALIQRQSGDSAAVAALARTQERELRTWLFDTPTSSADTLKSCLQQAVAEVEDTHGVPVELVVVGDTPAGEQVTALVAAAREAMVNAARHSGADRVDTYAEVDDDAVHVFVRDRGRGFEPQSIPEDRHGVRRSIIDRMERHGGHAEVKTDPDTGTEVRLSVPLEAEGSNETRRDQR